MLVKVDSGVNSNKFYELTALPDGGVRARWGRVGADGQTTTLPARYRGWDGVCRKADEKRARGYHDVRRAGGSQDHRPPARTLAAAAKAAAVSRPNPAIDALIDRLAAANRHAIETVSGGRITVAASGAVSTALGPVTADTIAHARGLLDRLETDPAAWMVDEYLMLIPQVVARTRGWESDFMSPAAVARQRDFLDQLDGAVAMSGDGDVEVPFRYQLRVASAESLRRLQARFDATANSRHGATHGRRIVAAYTITDSRHADWKALAGKSDKVRTHMWHGTGIENVLSILHRGLYVPPAAGSSVKVTGRMFGDGVYLSDQSTKALNYSAGVWGGSRGSGMFMFAADVAPGRVCVPTASESAHQVTVRSRKGGFDSLDVPGGRCGVLNNETIVWDTTRVGLRYLIEFA